jgi:hypothetical protein
LSEQWQDELREKFGLDFELFSREKQEQCHSRNYFGEQDRLIARLDQLSRNEDYQQLLAQTEWDLIVVDEAHKMSASYFGNKINETGRFKLGKLLGGLTRHFLLMTATPHNGKEEDFQLFMSLLDGDRFYGKFREGAHKVDVSDLMRRMVKEELLRFDGRPLFPERCAYTVNYTLSDAEVLLYDEVTDYVRNEMNRADRLDGKRKGTVGFALTQLQRRLASSPQAIYISLSRRRKKLEARLEALRLEARADVLRENLGEYVVKRKFDVPDNLDDAADELSADEYETLADQVVDQATAAETIPELQAEIIILQELGRPRRQGRAVAQRPQMGGVLPSAAGRARNAHRRRPPSQADRFHRAPRHAELPAAAHPRHAGQRGGGGHHPWWHQPRRPPQDPGRIPQQPRCAGAAGHRRGRGGRQPAKRQPHGQLRPAVEPQPHRTALWPHPPHRPARGLPPVEPGCRPDPRG